MSHRYRLRQGIAPEPTLKLKLRPPGVKTSSQETEGIIDTGADTTIVPAAILKRLHLKPVGQGKLVTQWGDEHFVAFYLTDIEIDSVLLPAVRVAGDEETSEILIGRNILNKLALFLDGPEQQTQVLEDATVQRLRSRRSS